METDTKIQPVSSSLVGTIRRFGKNGVLYAVTFDLVVAEASNGRILLAS